MNAQEEKQHLFDAVVDHFKRQKAKSMTIGGRCRYRSISGLKCFAAPFIREYDPKMEGLPFMDLIKEWPSSLDPLAVRHAALAQSLQQAHDCSDSYEFITEATDKLKGIARDYRLTCDL